MSLFGILKQRWDKFWHDYYNPCPKGGEHNLTEWKKADVVMHFRCEKCGQYFEQFIPHY